MTGLGAWLLEIVWYFFPAMLLNLVLYLVPFLFSAKSMLPLDMRLQTDGRRVVGDGRGWSGLPWVFLVAAACSWWQGRGGETLVLTAGTQFGMIVLSLVKRQLGMPRGTPFQPWEHIDFVLGAVLFQALSGGLSPGFAVASVLVCGFVHWSVGGAIKVVLSPPGEASKPDSNGR